MIDHNSGTSRIFLFRFLALAILSIAGPAHALDGSFLAKEYLVLDADITAKVDLIPTGNAPVAEYVIADLFFHPITDERLEILSINTTPASKTVDSRIRFTWLGPDEDSLDFTVSSKLKSKTIFTQLPNKIGLPIGFVPPEAAGYLKETETVDYSDPSIKAKANELSAGQDDLFIFASRAASFVRSTISYNLSTVTAKASKPASWVLKNKQGVCDELTNLFLAIMRAKGIPARFVSGLSYTNSPDFPEKWGAHGWAEVFFPGYGWIPFDPTYGQSGWIDPSHIKLKEGIDATEPSTTYEWRSTDIKLGIHPLKFHADVIQAGPDVPFPVTFTLEPAYTLVGPESYNTIIATIINKDNSYRTLDVTIGETEGIAILDEPRKDFALRPFERTTSAWTIKLRPAAVLPNYLYVFPVTAVSQRNTSAITSFNVSVKGTIIELDDAKAISKGHKAAIEGLPQPTCQTLTSQPHIDTPIQIVCTISSTSTKPVPESLLCAEGKCARVIGGQANQTLTISVTKHAPGRQETLVTLNAGNRTTYTSVTTHVQDSPKLRISNLSAPDSVGYDDQFNLTITVTRESQARPSSATVTVSLPGISSSWPVQEAQETTFGITINAADLAGKGGADVTLTYEDENGQAVSERRRVEISYADLTPWQSMKLLFNRMSLWINSNLDAGSPTVSLT